MTTEYTSTITTLGSFQCAMNLACLCYNVLHAYLRWTTRVDWHKSLTSCQVCHLADLQCSVLVAFTTSKNPILLGVFKWYTEMFCKCMLPPYYSCMESVTVDYMCVREQDREGESRPSPSWTDTYIIVHFVCAIIIMNSQSSIKFSLKGTDNQSECEQRWKDWVLYWLKQPFLFWLNVGSCFYFLTQSCENDLW